RQGVDKQALNGALVADLADSRCEDRGNHFDCFTCGQAGSPVRGLGRALGIGRNQIKALAGGLRSAPIEELIWGDDHFVFQTLELGASAMKQGAEDLIAASIEKRGDVG